MTREQAIANLEMISVAFVEPVTKEQRKLIDDTFDMAIQALSQEPCDKCKYFDGNSCQHYDYKVGYTQGYEDASNRFRQEPCDDAISREDVIHYLECHKDEIHSDVLTFVKHLPSVSTTKNIVNHGTMNISL